MEKSVIVNPTGSMNVLSVHEVVALQDTSRNGLYALFRSCALAVMSDGEKHDNAALLLQAHKDFDIKIIQQHRGVKLHLINPPKQAFVRGKLIRGIRENLFAVLRDILYVYSELTKSGKFYPATSEKITDFIFHILRNARALIAKKAPNIVVCWGGHAIQREEYVYCKEVGYELGLRGFDICTGCGPGAMKGPMKGAHIAHAKQRITQGRFIGLTEPGIITAESPNPIANQLVILPDIEKRIEAFIRLGHAFVVFPGGPGTIEEILYLLGVLSHPQNSALPMPLIITGPKSSAVYLDKIYEFITTTLGTEITRRFKIILADPKQVADSITTGIQQVTRFRYQTGDAYHFNWQLRMDEAFQRPFTPTHETMQSLRLDLDAPVYQLCANLRRAMSGIVAGNMKHHGIVAVREKGPFLLKITPRLGDNIDQLLEFMVRQGRMKIGSAHYDPCYRIDKSGA